MNAGEWTQITTGIGTVLTASAAFVGSIRNHQAIGVVHQKVADVEVKVDGFATAQAARIDQLAGTIAKAPGVALPERLPNGDDPPPDHPPLPEVHTP